MRGVISKLLGVMINKKLGYKVDIQLNDLQITSIEGRTHIHVNADAEIDENEFKKITKVIGL